MKVTVVTVTYGDRLHLLTQTLDAARRHGAAQAIVIDNGALHPLAEALAARYGDWVQISSLGANRGSAAGFKTGIEQALARHAELILLLDDDNVMQPGCLATLQAAYFTQTGVAGWPLLAVFGFRAARHGHLLAQACGTAARLRTSSTFRGFHILDMPAKISNRLKPAMPEIGHPPATIAASWGPYGGLMFHSALVARIGLPDTSFVLYEDDTEFTSRIIKAGGEILLVPAAGIEDVDRSWAITETRRNSFSVWLDGEPAFRAYYAFRNGVYFDLHSRGKNYPILYLNMMIYMLTLLGIALCKRRFRRARLLSQAFWSGLSGTLGMRPEMPLGGAGASPRVDHL